MRPAPLSLLAAPLLVVALSACGKDSSSPEATATSPPPSPSQPGNVGSLTDVLLEIDDLPDGSRLLIQTPPHRTDSVRLGQAEVAFERVTAGRSLCILNQVVLYATAAAASDALAPTSTPVVGDYPYRTETDTGAPQIADASHAARETITVARSLLGCPGDVPGPGDVYRLVFRKGRIVAQILLEGNGADRDLAVSLAQRQLRKIDLLGDNIASAPLFNDLEQVSLEQASSEAGFPLQVPTYLPEGVVLERVDVMRRLLVSVVEVTVTLWFAERDQSERGKGFALGERRKMEQPCGFPAGSSWGATPVAVQVEGVQGQWLEGFHTQTGGANHSLDWKKDGVCFNIQAPADVGLSQSDILQIADSMAPAQ